MTTEKKITVFYTRVANFKTHIISDKNLLSIFKNENDTYIYIYIYKNTQVKLNVRPAN